MFVCQSVLIKQNALFDREEWEHEDIEYEVEDEEEEHQMQETERSECIVMKERRQVISH